MKLSIIMPAHNEEKRIGETLLSYLTYFERLKKRKELDYEIIVVINATSDKTESVVKAAMTKKVNLSYLNLKLGGKGYAITEGFKEALKSGSDLIGFVDADEATPPEAYYDLVLNIKKNDGIIASRYIAGAIVKPKQTLQRIIASRIFNFIIRSFLFLPYKDTQCGAKIFKKETIKQVLPVMKSTKWAYDVELLYESRRKGFRIIEFPTIWRDKEYSQINLMGAGPKMFLAIIRLRLLHSPLKIFVKIYDRIVNRILWKK